MSLFSFFVLCDAAFQTGRDCVEDNYLHRIKLVDHRDAYNISLVLFLYVSMVVK